MAVLDQITLITYDMATDVNLDLIEYDHAMVEMLFRKAKVVSAPGANIRVPIRYRRNATGAFEYFDPLPRTRVEQFARASVAWKNLVANVSISSDELIYTIGMDAETLRDTENFDGLGAENAMVLVNLIQEMVAAAPNDLRQEAAAAFWGNGTGRDGKVPDGLVNIILNNTASYAGLAADALGTDPDGDNFWASYVAGTAGNTDSYDLNAIRTDRSGVLRGRAVRPDTFYAFVSSDIYGGLEFTLQGQVQYAGGSAVELGFDAIRYRNLTYVEDADANTYASAAVYYVNFQYLQMYIHKVWNMKMTAWRMAYDQQAITTDLLLKSQLVCSDRHRLGVRQGITI